MATLKAVFIKRKDNTKGPWPVCIRISQKGESSYISTPYDVDKRYVDSKGRIKDSFTDRLITPIINKYRDHLNNLSLVQIENYSAKRLKEYILQQETVKKIIDVNFISFCFDYIEQMESEDKRNSAMPLRTVANTLRDYEGNYLSASSVTSKYLLKYEEYLRQPRSMQRINQLGKTLTVRSKGLSDAGIFKHMANLRLLFNACRFHFNDEDTGNIIIPNNPFAKYKIKPVRLKKQRHLLISDIVRLAKYIPEGTREEIAKDMFLLSFFLCGINSVDIYNYPLNIKKGRIGYNRSKTMGKRDDGAFISIAVPEPAKEILNKYPNYVLKRRYSDSRNFAKALNIGLKQIGDKLGFTATFYHARHSFATIARNDCRCSKDDVAMALNHVDQSLRVTDTYIAKDWGIVDDVQSKVLQLFFDKLNQTI